ncbi:MAG: MliC family protein [Bacteroidetes bacterium]|nr:MliC family protein [Bacteroidota bacterium]
MAKRIIAVLILVLVTFSCTNNKKKSKDDGSGSSELINNSASQQELKSLTCGNGYTIRYRYINADSLYVEVLEGNKIEKHQMKPVPSGSGAKYQTDDGKFVFWSHHGDFTYYKNDEMICLYVAPVKIGSTSSGPLYTATYKSGKILEVEVDNLESASTNKLNITSDDFKEAISIKMETDPITAVLLADLDKNGYEELYLITSCVGSGGYGEVYAFISDMDVKIIQSSIPKILEDQTKRGAMFEGYMGHDTFYIKNSLLVREFPVYKEKDSNANPTGGIKKIFYTLEDNKFKILSNDK